MKTNEREGRRGFRSGWMDCLLLSICGFGAMPLFAGPALSIGDGRSPYLRASFVSSAAPVRPLLALEWWNQLYSAFESSVASRQGMLQFGAVGMLIALFIIWYRK